MGIGENALTLARPVFPAGTHILENIAAATMRDNCPILSLKSPAPIPALNINQCTCTCCLVNR